MSRLRRFWRKTTNRSGPNRRARGAADGSPRSRRWRVACCLSSAPGRRSSGRLRWRRCFSRSRGLASGCLRRAPSASAASSCSRLRFSPSSPRSCGCAGRERATSRPASTATPAPTIVPRPRSPIASPMPRTRSPARSGRNTRPGSPARSRRSASPRPLPAWPSATLMRCASARPCSPSRRRWRRGPNSTTASPRPSTGAAARPSPLPREAGSTPGSTLRPSRDARRSSSTSRAPIRRP